MQVFQGIAVSPGVAIGEAFVVDREGFRIPRQSVSREAVDDELRRWRQAVAAVASELESHQRDVSHQLGDQYGAIFSAQLQMLRDAQLQEEIESLIRSHQWSPEYAVSQALRRYTAVFQNLENRYLAERAHDMFDIEKRLLGALLGRPRERPVSPDLAGHSADAQPDAQRGRQPRPALRAGDRVRDRRAGQPHGDRGRGAGHSRRRRHGTVSDRGLGRRPADRRRRHGTGHPAAGRGDARALPPAGGTTPQPGGPAGTAARPAGRNPRRASHSAERQHRVPQRSRAVAWIGGPTASGCTAPSSSTWARPRTRRRRITSRRTGRSCRPCRAGRS